MNNISKMTEREILNMMINGTISKELLKEYGLKKIAQLNKKNETARKRAELKREKDDPLLDAVFNILYEQPMSREDVLESLLPDFPDLTIGKVSYRLSKLVRDRPDAVIKQEAFTDGGDGHVRKLTVYTRIG